MGQFIVLLVVVLLIYSLLKPSKKKQAKKIVVNNQDLQKILSNIEAQKKTTQVKNVKNKNQTQNKNQQQKTETEYASKAKTTLEKIEIEVKTYDDAVKSSDIVLETQKRSKGFENLDKSELYEIKEMDLETTFEKENEKWLKQTQKDNTEPTVDKPRKKTKLAAKDIKKAYITNQILERKYI